MSNNQKIRENASPYKCSGGFFYPLYRRIGLQLGSDVKRKTVYTEKQR